MKKDEESAKILYNQLGLSYSNYGRRIVINRIKEFIENERREQHEATKAKIIDNAEPGDVNIGFTTEYMEGWRDTIKEIEDISFEDTQK